MNQTRNETAVITPTARVTAARLAIREARPRRLTSTLLWAAQILMGALFILLGCAKLAGGGVQEFGLIGAGQWFRYFVGAAELAGGIGLLMPWLAGLAAAVLHNTSYEGMVWVTLVLCAVFALLAYGRRRQINALWAAIRR